MAVTSSAALRAEISAVRVSPVRLIPDSVAYPVVNVVQTAFLPLAVAAAVGLAVRYRRATPDVRHQIKWVAYASLLTAIALLTSGLVFGNPLGALLTVGPLILKGKSEPVAAFRLLEVSQTRAALRASTAARTTAFVDRQSDLTILHNFLRQVENGHRQAVGIVGEPGIGKSRLLAEFREQIGPGRVTWLEGRCLSYGMAIPYLLILDILRSNCGIVENDSREAIADKVSTGLTRIGMDPEQDGPVLFDLLGIKDASGSPSLSNPESAKAIAFEIFRNITVKLSSERPLVLVLEDLHWIDKISE
jgi:hypothetical protein